MKSLLKLRDSHGYLINRCNRCGRALNDNNRCFAGDEPICSVCADKLSSKNTGSYPGRKGRVRRHREDYYFRAINKLIDGKADVGYVQGRWNKLKQIRNKK